MAFGHPNVTFIFSVRKDFIELFTMKNSISALHIALVDVMSVLRALKSLV